MKYFKIYGLERTGTNYITSLIGKNFSNVKVFMNIGGDKHKNLIQFPTKKQIFEHVSKDIYNKYKNINLKQLFDQKKIIYLICVKNPYTWIDSYLNYYGNNKPWLKQLDRTEENIIYATKLWNSRYKNYSKYIKEGSAYVVIYEEILDNYNDFLRKMMKKFNLKKKEKNFINIEKKLRANSEDTIGRVGFKKFDKKDFYLQSPIDKIYKEKEFNLINKYLDNDLLKFYGYKVQKYKNKNT